MSGWSRLLFFSLTVVKESGGKCDAGHVAGALFLALRSFSGLREPRRHHRNGVVNTGTAKLRRRTQRRVKRAKMDRQR